MTVAELRALLETLPERFDDTEVCVTGTVKGLTHVKRVELQSRRRNHNDFPHIRPERLARKLIIDGEGYGGRVWYELSPEWSLEGWWPEEAAEIGLGAP